MWCRSNLPMNLRIVFALFAGLLASCAFAAQAAAPKQPNVILVLTDDQGYGDLSCHGNPVLKTPNLDRLHGESVRLDRLPRRADVHADARAAADRRRRAAQRRDERQQRPHAAAPRDSDDGRHLRRRRLPTRPVRQVAPRRQLSLPPAGPRFPRSRSGFPRRTSARRAGLLEQRLLRRHLLAQRRAQAVRRLLHRRLLRRGDALDARVRTSAEKPFFVYLPTNAPHGPLFVPDEVPRAVQPTSRGTSPASSA